MWVEMLRAAAVAAINGARWSRMCSEEVLPEEGGGAAVGGAGATISGR